MTARDVAPAPGGPAEPYPEAAGPEDAPPPSRFRERLGGVGHAARRGFRRALRVIVALGLIAVVSYFAGVVAASLADEYGYRPERDRQAWLATTPRYADGSECVRCHSGAVSRLASAQHEGVDCQTCHGPLAAHVADPFAARVTRPVISKELPGSTAEPQAAPILPDALTAEGQVRTCLTCHQRVVGRATTFPTIDVTKHFSGPPCITCHRPHAPAPLEPPIVLHPLKGLPPCITCHRVDGIRPLPERHPEWSGPCLDCHRTTDATAVLRREEA